MGKLAAVQGDYHSHCGAKFGPANQNCVSIDGHFVLVLGAQTVDGHPTIQASSFVTIDGKHICVTSDAIAPHPPPVGGGVIVTGTQTFYYID